MGLQEGSGMTQYLHYQNYHYITLVLLNILQVLIRQHTANTQSCHQHQYDKNQNNKDYYSSDSIFSFFELIIPFHYFFLPTNSIIIIRTTVTAVSASVAMATSDALAIENASITFSTAECNNTEGNTYLK